MIANGKSNKEIAAQLGIRIDSVEDITNALYAKLSVSNRAEAVNIAHRRHLLSE
jgi:DNA-binding NarL/FixJ family response regulator